nr:hypothetical protein [Desulfomicrobium norvegicum]
MEMRGERDIDDERHLSHENSAPNLPEISQPGVAPHAPIETGHPEKCDFKKYGHRQKRGHLPGIFRRNVELESQQKGNYQGHCKKKALTDKHEVEVLICQQPLKFH